MPETETGCHWDDCPHGANCTHATPRHPAAPETETDANGWVTDDDRECLMVAFGIEFREPVDHVRFAQGVAAVGRIVAERVRVVEGERDAAREAGYWVGYGEGKDEAETRDLNYDEMADDLQRKTATIRSAEARAESAEAAHEVEKAAHERLRAGVWALAERWGAHPVAESLRALIHNHADPTHGGGHAALPCGTFLDPGYCDGCDTARHLLGGGGAR